MALAREKKSSTLQILALQCGTPAASVGARHPVSWQGFSEARLPHSRVSNVRPQGVQIRYKFRATLCALFSTLALFTVICVLISKPCATSKQIPTPALSTGSSFSRTKSSPLRTCLHAVLSTIIAQLISFAKLTFVSFLMVGIVP